MKIGLFLASLAGVVALQASEPLVVPSFVKYFKDLDEAKKEAAASNKGLTFLLMEPGST
jgi:hypothetical protein